MEDIIILSDDLTGANDSGVQFAKRGLPTVVCIDDKEPLVPAGGGSACVINVESRSLTADEAYVKWSQLLHKLDLRKFQIVFKKIDSTLRGHIGKEIEAALDSGHFDLAIVAPAYPQKARWTVGGYQLLNHQLLEDSEISRDPKHPVTHSHISDIISGQTSIPVGEVDIRAIRSGRLKGEVRLLQQQGKRVVVADSATPDDLAIIAGLFPLERVLWVGSAGLAEALANRYPLLGFEPASPMLQLVSAPVLVVAGSVSHTTRQQIETLTQHGFRLLAIDPLLLLHEAGPNMEALVQEARTIVDAGDDLVITTQLSQASATQVAQYLQKAGLSTMLGGDRIADGMGRLAAVLITNAKLSGAVLTGGDIAYQTCKHLHIARLQIIGEVEEGLPLCEAYGNVSIPLVTKAGAFGHSNSLLHAAQAIKHKRSQP